MDNNESNDNDLVHKEYSKLQLLTAGIVFILVMMGALYVSTNTFVTLINHKVALTSEYQYAQLVPTNVDTTVFYITLMCGFFYIFILLNTVFSWINRVSWTKTLAYTVASIIPLVMIWYQYQSTDEYMYEPISKLYNDTVSSNPNFVKSNVGIQFSKALISHDYATLKTLTNNLDGLKVMDLKFNRIIEVVNLLPLPKSVEAFNKLITNSTGFVSVADYKAFYKDLLVEFKANEISNRKEFVFLVDLINPDRYVLPNK